MRDRQGWLSRKIGARITDNQSTSLAICGYGHITGFRFRSVRARRGIGSMVARRRRK
ncbi:hypothetical protein Pd630_LPD05488 [Rhodococcus opacus PD630]|nr:hypothetical protein Pd630_LPD05488 [Rhodococcus opacus PD630]